MITGAVYDKTSDYEMEYVNGWLTLPENLPALKTTDGGLKARILEFPGSPPRTLARMAIIDTPQAVCLIELAAPDQSSYQNAIPAFENVVRSFQYFGPATGEHLACEAIDKLLLWTAEVSESIVPPSGWKAVPGEPDITVYQRASGSSYGIIAIYSPKPSEGDPLADYEIAWRQLAMSGSSAPAPRSSVEEFGWQIRVGERTEDKNGRQTTTLVAVYSGFGKYTGVLVSFNDSSYRAEIEKFLAENVHPAGEISGSGDWTFRDIGNYDRQFVNGTRIATEFATRSYRFGKDTYRLEGTIGLKSGDTINIEESGTFSISGNKLTLRGQGGTQTVVDSASTQAVRVLPPWERTYIFRLVKFEDAIHGPFLVLEGVEENDIDGAYSGGFPNAFVYILGFH